MAAPMTINPYCTADVMLIGIPTRDLNSFARLSSEQLYKEFIFIYYLGCVTTAGEVYSSRVFPSVRCLLSATFSTGLLCLWTNGFRLTDGGRLIPSLYFWYLKQRMKNDINNHILAVKKEDAFNP